MRKNEFGYIHFCTTLQSDTDTNIILGSVRIQIRIQKIQITIFIFPPLPKELKLYYIETRFGIVFVQLLQKEKEKEKEKKIYVSLASPHKLNPSHAYYHVKGLQAFGI